MHKFFVSLLLISGLFLFSCKVNDANVNVLDVPDEVLPPDFSDLKMNTDIFEIRSKQNSTSLDSENNYLTAREFVAQLDSLLGHITGTFDQFTEPVQTVDPEYTDDEFIWTYTVSFLELTSELNAILKAQVSTSTASWIGLVSGEIDGIELNQYELITGTSSLDEKAGEFELHFDHEQNEKAHILSLNWVFEDDRITHLDFSRAGSSGLNFDASYTFENTTAVITGTVLENDLPDEYRIEWDIETGKGKFNDLCWDSDKNDIDC